MSTLTLVSICVGAFALGIFITIIGLLGMDAMMPDQNRKYSNGLYPGEQGGQ